MKAINASKNPSVRMIERIDKTIELVKQLKQLIQEWKLEKEFAKKMTYPTQQPSTV